MGGPRNDIDDIAVVYVLPSLEFDGCVIDSVQLKSEQTHRHLAGQTSGEVVYQEMDVHAQVLSLI